MEECLFVCLYLFFLFVNWLDFPWQIAQISFATNRDDATASAANGPAAAVAAQHAQQDVNEFVDDDDIFFEEFVRLRMEGETEA